MSANIAEGAVAVVVMITAAAIEAAGGYESHV